MTEEQATKNTDTVLHEDVDCRIILTAQHALGIDVCGTVIVRDPLEWHRMASLIGQLERQIVAIREIGRDESKGDRDRIIDMRGAACLLDIDEAKYRIGTNSDEPLDDKTEAASTAQDRNGRMPGMQSASSSRQHALPLPSREASQPSTQTTPEQRENTSWIQRVATTTAATSEQLEPVAPTFLDRPF